MRQLLALLVFAVIALVSYVHFYGLPSEWKDAVLQELARRGVKLQIDSLHWDPMRGVVAHGVEFNAGENGGSVKVRELALNIRMSDLMHRNFSLETLEVDGADIHVFPGGTVTPIIVERTAGTFRFEKKGVIQLVGVTGDLHGLHLEINGQLDLSKPATGTTTPKPPPDLAKIQKYLDMLAKTRVVRPVGIRISVDGKISEPENMRVQVEVDGGTIIHEGWRVDGVNGKVLYEGGVVSLPALTVEAHGGKAILSGSYDVAKHGLLFEFYSNINPAALMEGIPVGQRPRVLTDLDFKVSPEFWLKGAADMSAPVIWNGMDAEGSVWIREMSWRGNLVREARGNAHIAKGVLELPNLSFVQDSGRMTGSFAYPIASRTIAFNNCSSTLDIAAVMNLLYPTGKNWFRTVGFTKPPLTRLEGTWDLGDPNGLHAKGDLDWEDWVSNGVSIKRMRTRVDISGRKFHFADLRLEREEGSVVGDFSMDFNTNMAELNATSTMGFLELTRFVGPKTEELFAPYQFLSPPRIQFKGSINFGTQPLNDLWAHVECKHFKIWKFTSRGLVADVRSFRRSLEISKFDGELYGGRLEGNAMFDFSTPEQDWGFHCRVKRVDFDRFTHELWDYDQVQGYMTGWAEMNGVMANSRPLKGFGEVEISDGVLWKIPLFGELSKFIPLLGVQRAKKAHATFTVADEKMKVDDMKINAGIMSLSAKGYYHFDKSLDFNVQGHFLPDLFIPRILDPLTKAFEFHLGGKLNDRKWKPRYLPKELLLHFGDDGEPKEPGK